MVATVVVFLGLLTAAAQAAVVVAVALLFGARAWPALAGAKAALREEVGPHALVLAWIVALVATAGSLFFSEVADFVPCTLCWYQRIAMYPLLVILGVAAWRGDAGVRWYAGPLAAIGLVLGGYHYAIQLRPNLEATACTSTIPCTMIYVLELGYITIPLMAATGFAAIGVLLALARRQQTDDHDTDAG